LWGGRHWNTKGERLRRLEANLDAHREHLVNWLEACRRRRCGPARCVWW